MKIDFSQMKKASLADTDGENYTSHVKKENMSARGLKEQTASGFRLDISGTVMENAAFGMYDSQGKTAVECMQEISGKGIAAMDVSLQHNYLAVMSNSLSAEDYKKLSEDGFCVGSMKAEDVVTVVDEIKVKLAEAGVTIEGYNDDLDSDTLDSISNGNSAQLKNRIENALRRNDLPVTNANVDALKKAADMADMLSSQTEGDSLSDSSIRYLISNGQEITLENVYLSLFKGTDIPVAPITDAELLKLQSSMSQVIENSGAPVNEETLAAASWLVENNIPLTEETFGLYSELSEIKLPLDTDKLLDSACSSITFGQKSTDALIVHRERVIAESRLAMTTEANRKLLASDYTIDTKELEDQVSLLKEREKALAGREGGITEKEFFSHVNTRVEEIKSLPAAVIADFTASKDFSLQDVYEHGTSLKLSYEKAEYSYEALRTEIRSDLGDSLKKAFSNAKDLLKEIDLPATSENQRAVRILGYNRMEISEENISSVKEADEKITGLIDKMKPAAVLRLIRDGINPLKMNVDELSKKLDDYQDEGLSDEKYSKYLWKLEKSDQITESEREAYVGVFRLIHQIEKSDGAAIGSLVNQNAEVTLKNMLSAIRSRKSSGMDYSVDDSFGGIDAITDTDIRSISAQIEQAFGDEKQHQSLEQQYNEEMAAKIREAMDAEESVVEILTRQDIPVTTDNLMAMSSMLYQRGDVFRQLRDMGKALQTADFIEHFDNEEDATAAIEDLVSQSESDIQDAINAENMSYDRFENLLLMQKQIRLVGVMAAKQQYELPVEINGELTSVNLKVVHDENRSGVDVSFYTEDVGTLSISMDYKNGSIDGYMMADGYYGEEFLAEKRDDLIAALSKEGDILPDAFKIVQNRGINIASIISKKMTEYAENTDKKADSATLYRMAKSFIEVLQK